MLIISICVGSSCHIKGSEAIVELFQRYVEACGLEDKIVLQGCFCQERCNREGVTVTVGDDVFTGITKENFKEFWQTNVLPRV
uniref:(2Fe-2S) ferredoxin domain-containing protein n=1 Tax=Candidatus Fimenecus sp. TaxID=3022888 RepID=UPI0040299A0E